LPQRKPNKYNGTEKATALPRNMFRDMKWTQDAPTSTFAQNHREKPLLIFI
jgi:hypothetical protein